MNLSAPTWEASAVSAGGARLPPPAHGADLSSVFLSGGCLYSPRSVLLISSLVLI